MTSRMTRKQAADVLGTLKHTNHAIGERECKAIDMAIEALQPTVKPTLEDIIEAVCDITGVTKQELVMRARNREYCYARYMVIWVTRQCTNITLTTLGRRLGYKDHVVCTYATHQGDYWMKHPSVNPEWVDRATNIINRLKYK